MNDHWSRRRIIRVTGLSAGLWLLGASDAAPVAPAAAEADETAAEEEEISPTEDLMREHGILQRVLLIYETGLDRLNDKAQSPVTGIAGGASIVRRFIEDYHEKQEEDFVFPRLEQAGKLTDLVATLRAQHQRGRQLTDTIQQLCTTAAATDDRGRRRLADALHTFIRMYRPHAAREDTVLFPAFHRLLSEHQLAELGEQFEEREHRRFGERGFAQIVADVAGLEQELGIGDLARFT